MNRQHQLLEYQRMHDAARRRAHALRHQAIADVWSYAAYQALRLVDAIRHPLRHTNAPGIAGEKPCQC